MSNYVKVFIILAILIIIIILMIITRKYVLGKKNKEDFTSRENIRNIKTQVKNLEGSQRPGVRQLSKFGGIQQKNLLPINKRPVIAFVMRSYERLDYLKQTISSINNSDINYCKYKIIYDDNSQDIKLKQFLNGLNSKYIVYTNDENVGQISMQKALAKLYKYNDIDYICYLDNDVKVNKNIIKIFVDTFNKIREELLLSNTQILLTGFNCTTEGQHRCSHHIIKSYINYHEKISCGGVSLFFHRDLLPYIIKWWRFGSNKPRDHWDWSVVKNLKSNGGRIFSTKPSIVQHIGEIGSWSSKKKYDKTSDFKEHFNTI